MEEKAVKGAGQLIDYGVLGIMCVIFIAGLVLIGLILKKNYEKQLKEKEQEIQELRRELNDLRDKVEGRLGDLLDNCGDAIHENSKALYENAAITNEVKGILLSIHELMKNK